MRVLAVACVVTILTCPAFVFAQRGAAPPVVVDTSGDDAAASDEVDYSTMNIRILGHNMVLDSREHFDAVFVNYTINNETDCFDVKGLGLAATGYFTGNVTTGDYNLTANNGTYIDGTISNSTQASLTFGDYDYCCINPNMTNATGASGMNHTIVRCYLNITEVQAITFEFEKEEEDLVRSHWENFQHPKPTVLYKQLAENMREEIRTNFIRTQTVKYEHDVVKESLHNETVRVKTVDEKRAENRRKMDLLFARHKARVTGLHLESARVLDSLEDQRRETSDHLADLKEDHLATVAALNQNARDVDEHLRVKTEEHMDSMSNYYQRWHDNHEDAEETILNLRRSNGRVGEGMEDAGEFYFGNPEPVLNITELGNTTNASAVSNAAEDDGDRRRRMLQADGDIVGSTKGYDIIREHVDDDDDLWISDTGNTTPRDL